jgi:hypothetical protein
VQVLLQVMWLAIGHTRTLDPGAMASPATGTEAGVLADANAPRPRDPRCMTHATPSPSPVLHEIRVNVVSAEEASVGVAKFWSGDRLIGFTLIEDGDLALRIEACPDPVVLGAHALAEALAGADRLPALY